VGGLVLWCALVFCFTMPSCSLSTKWFEMQAREKRDVCYSRGFQRRLLSRGAVGQNRAPYREQEEGRVPVHSQVEDSGRLCDVRE
jgi:hypothetical protein